MIKHYRADGEAEISQLFEREGDSFNRGGRGIRMPDLSEAPDDFTERARRSSLPNDVQFCDDGSNADVQQAWRTDPNDRFFGESGVNSWQRPLDTN